MNKILTYSGVLITLLTILITGVTRFNSLEANAEETRAKVADISSTLKEVAKDAEADINKIKLENAALDKAIDMNKQQQANTDKKVDAVNDKLDKVVDILIKMSEKKK